MPALPQRKVGIIACSGEELPQGTVSRLAALRVLESLRPQDTVTICLPLFLAGGMGDRAFAKFHPTITVDGCEKRCAARATELYSNRPAASFVVDEWVAAHGLPPPEGCRRLTPASALVVESLAGEIASEVDRLIAARWSRSAGALLDDVPAAQVSTSGCACGSGVPVTTVRLHGRELQIMALEPIMKQASNQGLRDGENLPDEVMATVRMYNEIPEEDASLWNEAVAAAWQAYCLSKEAGRG